MLLPRLHDDLCFVTWIFFYIYVLGTKTENQFSSLTSGQAVTMMYSTRPKVILTSPQIFLLVWLINVYSVLWVVFINNY